MIEKGDLLPDYVSTVDVRKGKTPVRLSNSNGSSHKGEAHGREEEYESVLPKKDSIKTASMGESELEFTDGDEGDMEEEKDVETTKKSSSKTSSKKRETEEEKKQRLKKEKEDEKIAAKIAKREAKALERVHETVADLPVIKDKLATAPPPPGEARPQPAISALLQWAGAPTPLRAPRRGSAVHRGSNGSAPIP